MRKKNGLTTKTKLAISASLFVLFAAAVAFVLCFTVIGGKLHYKGSESLDLRNAGITGLDGVGSFFALEMLDIRGNDIPVEEVAEYMRRHPECRVIWSIPLGSGVFDSDSRSIITGELTAEELWLLDYFTELEFVDATGSRCYAALAEAEKTKPDRKLKYDVQIAGRSFSPEAQDVDLLGADLANENIHTAIAAFPGLRSADLRGCGLPLADAVSLTRDFPHVDFQFGVSVHGAYLDLSCDRVDLTGITGIEQRQLEEILSLVRADTIVDISGHEFDGAECAQLAAEHPDVVLIFDMSLFGVPLSTSDETIDLTGAPVEAAELLNAMTLFPYVKTVELGDAGVLNTDMDALLDAYPEVEFSWTFRLCGVEVSTKSELVVLSDIAMSDTSEVEAAMPYLRNVKQIDMCGCGISNEEMALLNAKYPGCKFVWMITVGRFMFRTDAESYGTMVNKRYVKQLLESEDLENLRYCTDLIALDLGHNQITDLTVIGELDKLQILILGDNYITDISPLAGCRELVFIEIFMNDVADVSPLATLPKLAHLCITGNNVQNPEEFKRMTSLKRLWIAGNDISDRQVESIQDALPDCIVNNQHFGTDGGWRAYGNPVYDWMRAYFRPYLDPDGVKVILIKP